MKYRQYKVLTFIFFVTFILSGCKDPYRTALSSSAKVSDTVHEAIDATTQYYGSGKLTDTEKQNIANYLTTVTNANMKFRHSIVELHNSGVVGKAEYLGLAQAFIDSVPTDPLAFSYKSKDAQQKFTEVLGAVKTALNSISLAIQNAKGVN